MIMSSKIYLSRFHGFVYSIFGIKASLVRLKRPFEVCCGMSVSGYAFEWFTDRLFPQIEVFAIKLNMYHSLKSMFNPRKDIRCLLQIVPLSIC